MTGYGDLVAWTAQGVKLRRLHYVWGDEYRLIERVIDLIKGQEVVAEMTAVTATGKNDGDVWDELNQYPAIPKKKGKPQQVRLVIVRGAHLAHNFGPLEAWQKEMRSVHACFVGDERDFDAPLWRKARRCPRGHEVDEDEDVVLSSSRIREARYCKQCRDARTLIVKYGRVVRCARPKTERQKSEMVNLIAAEAGSSRGMATELLRRCDWSAGAAMEALDKIKVLERPLNEELMNAAVIRSAGGDYVEALRRGERGTAAGIAAYVDPESVPGILIACERWLGTASRGMSAVRSGRTTQEIVRLLDVSWSEAEMMRKGAGKYTHAAISRATEALAAADVAWHRDRARVGVLEQLAAGW